MPRRAAPADHNSGIIVLRSVASHATGTTKARRWVGRLGNAESPHNDRTRPVDDSEGRGAARAGPGRRSGRQLSDRRQAQWNAQTHRTRARRSLKFQARPAEVSPPPDGNVTARGRGPGPGAASDSDGIRVCSSPADRPPKT